MNEAFKLEYNQRTVVNEITRQSLISRFAARYHSRLKDSASKLQRLASIPNDPVARLLETKVAQMHNTLSAEVPLV